MVELSGCINSGEQEVAQWLVAQWLMAVKVLSKCI
jgi:hypothetical protein